MDEKDLQIFLTLAETGNLTRTAEKLYLAQPTLSKRLQNLESELGATLFLRSKHGVTLTPAGEAARETFLHTTKDFEDLRERLQKGRGIVSGTLRIATSIDYSTYRLPEVLAQYTTHYPEVKLQIYSEHSRECVRQMQTGRPPHCHHAGRVRVGRGQTPAGAGIRLSHPEQGQCGHAAGRAAVH